MPTITTFPYFYDIKETPIKGGKSRVFSYGPDDRFRPYSAAEMIGAGQIIATGWGYGTDFDAEYALYVSDLSTDNHTRVQGDLTFRDWRLNITFGNSGVADIMAVEVHLTIISL